MTDRIPWRARSGSWGPCSATRSRSRPGRTAFRLVERRAPGDGRAARRRRRAGPAPPARELGPNLAMRRPWRGRSRCYFQLVNLAEERQRVRTLEAREREAPRGDRADDSVRRGRRRAAGAGPRPRRPSTRASLASAHDAGADGPSHRGPAADDAPRPAPLRPAPRADARTRVEPGRARRGDAPLREELALLWRTAPVRPHAREPLDEVRTAMAFFDETIFRVVPQLYRAADRPPPPTAARGPPRVPAFLRLWIVDRRGSRRQPLGHGRADRRRRCASRPTSAARLRGGRHAAHADGRRDRRARR